MIKLYCYNSRSHSSVGFTRRAWTLRDGSFAELKDEAGGSGVWRALMDGSIDAACWDTGEETRVFMLRRIRSGEWYLNFAVETDESDIDMWRTLFAGFIIDHENTVSRFGSVFSVVYNLGERYEADGEKFADLLGGSGDDTYAALDSFIREYCNGAEEKKMLAATEAIFARDGMMADELYLLVPSVDIRYFNRNTDMHELKSPHAVIAPDAWKAILRKQAYTEPAEADMESESQRCEDIISELIYDVTELKNTLTEWAGTETGKKVITGAAIGAGAAALWYMSYRIGKKRNKF